MLESGGTILVNEDAFTEPNLHKAGYDADPLEDGSLDDYQLFRVPMTTMTVRATEKIEGISPREAARSKNLFALGVVSWMYDRPTEPTLEWIEQKFAYKPPILEANLAAFRAGWNFGETAELRRRPLRGRRRHRRRPGPTATSTARRRSRSA